MVKDGSELTRQYLIGSVTFLIPETALSHRHLFKTQETLKAFSVSNEERTHSAAS